ncbi:hypothetical protein DXG01_015064 [Tephrocybe rancida]|nr:hypothetical protein DXG01_015064 [Tephrocybe rancida]
MATDSAQPSWSTIFQAPPDVKYPYVEGEALGDLPGVCYALEMFLASHMVESEDYCRDSDTSKERLYFTTGYGLIQCVKGLMLYADEDLLSAINHMKHGNHIVSEHHKNAGFFGSLVGSRSTTAFLRSMTPVERHAELLYAESLFLKALLGIVYFAAPPKLARKLEDPSINPHFRSGVYLGTGMCNIILSLIHGKLVTLIELFGYKGDHRTGLAQLMRAGGWDGEGGTPEEPAPFFHAGMFFLFGAGRLALHHSQPRAAIDYCTRAMASQIQYRNLDHMLFWEVAVACLALWEVGEEVPGELLLIYSYGLAVCLLKDWDTDTDTLEGKKKKEERMNEAQWLMARMPHVRQKIAGKSIPLEVRTPSPPSFSLSPAEPIAPVSTNLSPAKPANLQPRITASSSTHWSHRPCALHRHYPQDVTLMHAALAKLAHYGDGTGLNTELTSPLEPVSAKSTKSFMSALSRASDESSTQKGKNPDAYEGGVGEYWDNLCLAQFLEGGPDVVLHPEEVVDIPRAEAEVGEEEAFRAVFEFLRVYGY